MAATWVEADHPRDEYGRFRLKGSAGVFDRPALAAEGRRFEAAIHAWENNQAMQARYSRRRDAGLLTADEDRHWDVIGPQAKALLDALPRAYHRGMRPGPDGFWYHQNPDTGIRSGAPYDSQGRRVPTVAAKGWVRVGDRPDRVEVEPGTGGSHHNEVVRGQDSPLAGGVWHRPGEYGPGRVPILRNDFGHPMNQLQPDPAKSRKHRRDEGAFARAEDRADRALFDHRARVAYDSKGRPYRRQPGVSSDVFAGFLLDPRNPVHRRRTARQQRNRQQNVTWVQRLNAQIEGR